MFVALSAHFFPAMTLKLFLTAFTDFCDGLFTDEFSQNLAFYKACTHRAVWFGIKLTEAFPAVEFSSLGATHFAAFITRP